MVRFHHQGLAELFQITVLNVNLHVLNIFAEGELEPDSVIKESLITAADGKTYRTKPAPQGVKEGS